MRQLRAIDAMQLHLQMRQLLHECHTKFADQMVPQMQWHLQIDGRCR